MNTQPNEHIQFRAFKKGKELAFEYFFNKYYNNIVGFGVQFIYDEEEAKNIAQEAFLNLWTNRNKIEQPSGIKSFLYTYTKSKCLNLIRSKKVREKYKSEALNKREALLNQEVIDALNFDSMDFYELEQIINKSIENLPGKTKTIFLKKRFDNKKNQEIADELEISLKTVESHITKALKALKEQLAPYFPTILISIILSSKKI
ncbi:RNA polymerase sigma-70 factor [Aestuariibaculum suncheonense]|uniref:RNA polymerase sigma-70 factor n=1 Tax=Aestuariibaculum suncheonense TaxID=1028745 RepID=A0A8J6UA82_9FLAO|nr:RNA polymerase sigma-70 factor [Aestuariibaculum suncheonense]MBD0834600.1 RNA polymerase sigma-70 factor [Aestuariibaculum suncheonense]